MPENNEAMAQIAESEQKSRKFVDYLLSLPDSSNSNPLVMKHKAGELIVSYDYAFRNQGGKKCHEEALEMVRRFGFGDQIVNPASLVGFKIELPVAINGIKTVEFAFNKDY